MSGRKQYVHEIIYHCSETLRICAVLLQPYMPTKMAKLLDLLGVSPTARTFVDAKLDSNPDYGLSDESEMTASAGSQGEKKIWSNRFDRALFPPLLVDFGSTASPGKRR